MAVDCDERGPLLKVAKLVAAAAGDVARLRAIVEDEANDIE